MPLDADLPHAPAYEASAPASAQQPLWPSLTRWWSPTAAASADAELGYESALPWVLTEQTPGDARPGAY